MYSSRNDRILEITIMHKIILKGHKVAKGRAEGEAVVTREPISFYHGINPETGVVIEKNHQLEGISIIGKILVFPIAKGSSAGSYQLYEMVRYKTAPKGIINLRTDPVIALGAIISDIPMVDNLDENPIDLIKTGDYVELDADRGIVEIIRKEQMPKTFEK
jgi:predicted aconitase with swiveling domain